MGEEKYIKSQPAEIAPLESSLSELRDPTQYVGLKNLGATCYVNSLIQVWFHNEDMRCDLSSKFSHYSLSLDV